MSNAPRELLHFLLLDHESQRRAILRMHQQGASDYTIASATRLSVEQIRRLLAPVEHSTNPEPSK